MDFTKFLASLSGEIIHSVMPDELLCKSIRLENGPVKKLVIPHLKIEAEIHGRVFVVGFGKGAFLLARGLDKVLQGVPVASAVLSVPEDGMGVSNSTLPAAYQIVKAAPSNIPDAHSALAGKLISELLSQVTASDLLIVLITGGGSALITAPVPPITIQDMAAVVKALHLRGAPIEHLNAVRQQLDVLKAGGMALLSYPARVLSFILSDVIGSDIDVIASGPTSLRRVNCGTSETLKILEKYSLIDSVPTTVSSFLRLPPGDPNLRLPYLRRMSHIPVEVADVTELDHVSNILIGSNTDAIIAAQEALKRRNIPSFIYEENFRGDAGILGEQYAMLAYYACQCLWAASKNTARIFCPIEEKIMSSAKRIELPNMKSKFLATALVSGGETTVVVKGTGKGGRNQEAALVASLALDKLWASTDKEFSSKLIANIMFLSTDGQDGPTASTGAIATPFIISSAKAAGLDPLAFLANNDSFNFWNQLDNGSFHICTGRTGTNVADVVVMIVGVAID